MYRENRILQLLHQILLIRLFSLMIYTVLLVLPVEITSFFDLVMVTPILGAWVTHSFYKKQLNSLISKVECEDLGIKPIKPKSLLKISFTDQILFTYLPMVLFLILKSM